MLQNTSRVDDVESAITELRQIRASVHFVSTAHAVHVVLPGQFDHGRRNVKADDLFDVVRQSLRQPSYTASEIECARPTSRNTQPRRLIYQLSDLLPTGVEKLDGVPPISALTRIGEDRPEGIESSERIPVAL